MNSALRQTFLALSAISLATIARAQAPNPDASAAAFASIAENEILQFREGITFGTWMNTRGKRDKWDLYKPEVDNLYPRHDCGELLKASELPDRATVSRTLYFYPPEPRPPYIFPTRIASPLSSCILGMLRIEAEAPSADNGAAFDHATREKLRRLYGESAGQGDVPFWGPSFRRDADRWIHGAEIVSGHDPNTREYHINDHEVVRGSTVYRARASAL